MAYDEDLADRVRSVLGAVAVDERRMFGGLAFLVDGHLGVAASAQGLMVRVDRADAAALLAEPGVEPVEMGSRGPMKGWLRVHGEALSDDATLRTWVQRGVASAAAAFPQR